MCWSVRIHAPVATYARACTQSVPACTFYKCACRYGKRVMVTEGIMAREGGQGEYPISTLVRLVRRARLVEIHEAPSAPMSFRLCVIVCVCVCACARARARVPACVLINLFATRSPRPRRRRLGWAITGSGGLSSVCQCRPRLSSVPVTPADSGASASPGTGTTSPGSWPGTTRSCAHVLRMCWSVRIRAPVATYARVCTQSVPASAFYG